MKIRDANATLNGDDTQYTLPSGELEIVADDGNPLFRVRLLKDGAIRIDGGRFCKHAGTVFADTPLIIKPHSSNVVFIERSVYSP